MRTAMALLALCAAGFGQDFDEFRRAESQIESMKKSLNNGLAQLEWLDTQIQKLAHEGREDGGELKKLQEGVYNARKQMVQMMVQLEVIKMQAIARIIEKAAPPHREGEHEKTPPKPKKRPKSDEL